MKQSANDIINVLRSSRERLIDKLQKIVNENRFHYRTFGTEIEEHLTDEIINILKESRYITQPTDYSIANNKNAFPDFTINCNPNLALEIKSGNRSQLSKGEWTETNNSENDMGTLNSWPKKINIFGGENIYYIFIEYNFNESTKSIIDIKIEPFYKFIGVNRDGMLKYREKDGNLRPKNFASPSPINSFDQFQKLLEKTIIYRSKRIILKHLKLLPQDIRKEFLEGIISTH